MALRMVIVFYTIAISFTAGSPRMKSVLFSALIAVAVCCTASFAHAQEFHRNAYGIYAAPSMYGLAKGNRYQLATSGGGMDVGVYYAHAFSASFSARLEVKYAARNLDDVENNQRFDTYSFFRLHESIIEVPLVLGADRRIPISDHELRVSVGGGVSYKYVLDQKLLAPTGEYTTEDGLTPADSYQKLGLLLDGGVTFGVDRKSAVFLRLRLDQDVTTFGEPADATVIRRFWALGFCAGFEYGF
jgi:hypothetical protein